MRAALNYDTRGFSAHDRQIDRDDVIERGADRLHADTQTVIDWFCGKGADHGYDLTCSDNAMELHDALIASAKKVGTMAMEFCSAMASKECSNVHDFFAYYGCDSKCADELAEIITETATPLAYESLHEYCMVQANEAEIERAMSWGEP